MLSSVTRESSVDWRDVRRPTGSHYNNGIYCLSTSISSSYSIAIIQNSAEEIQYYLSWGGNAVSLCSVWALLYCPHMVWKQFEKMTEKGFCGCKCVYMFCHRTVPHRLQTERTLRESKCDDRQICEILKWPLPLMSFKCCTKLIWIYCLAGVKGINLSVFSTRTLFSRFIWFITKNGTYTPVRWHGCLDPTV